MNRLVLLATIIVMSVLIAGVLIWKQTAPGKSLTTVPPGKTSLPTEVKAQRAEAARTRREEAAAARHEKNRAGRAAQTDELAKLIATNQQFTKLPEWIQDISVDARGQAWLQTEASDDDKIDAVKESVALAARGGTPLIRGRLLLHDSAGRFWVRISGGGDQLFGYDGEHWIERQALNLIATEVKSKGSYDRGRFIDRGFEDTKGNLYFFTQLTNRGGIGLHRRSADGAWTYQVLVDASDTTIASHILREPTFVEQVGGMFTLCSRIGSFDDTCAVLQFDGAKWNVLDPRECKAKGHSTLQIVPLPDGSILTVCGNSRLWTHWAPEALKRAMDRAEALVSLLESADPVERTDAHQKLGRMGTVILRRLEEVVGSLNAPESIVRMTALIHTLQKMNADASAETHDDTQLYACRYTYDACYVSARSMEGRTVLFVENCNDRFTKQFYPAAFATIERDGSWSLAPIDKRQWGALGYTHYPKDAFVDSKHRLWLEDSLRVTPEAKLERISSSFTYNRVIGEDFGGRIYLLSGMDHYILSEASSAVKPELPEVTLNDTILFSGPAGHAGWGLKLNDRSALVQRLGSARPAVVGTWTDVGVQRLAALSGENVIANLMMSDAKVGRENWSALWDGNAWHEGNDLAGLVHKEVDRLRACADMEMSDRKQLQLASDGEGHLWFHRPAAVGYDESPDQPELLEYYDGKNWHDVWTELKAIDPKYSRGEVARSIDHGKTLILGLMESNQIISACYKDGKLTASPLPSVRALDAHAFSNGVLDRKNGALWIWLPETRPSLWHCSDGMLKQTGFSERPLFADSTGDVFFAGYGHRLLVRRGEMQAELLVDGVSDRTPMAQSDDGKIWVLCSDALSQVLVTEANGSLAMKEVGRWSWGAPRMQFDRVFCDHANGLWFSPGGMTAIRVALP